MSQLNLYLAVLAISLALTYGLQKCSDAEVQACSSVNAECINNKCSCTPGFDGDPFIACFPLGTKFCSIVNDPRGTNFAGEPAAKGIDIPVPCRYLAASFNTQTKATSDGPPTQCQLQIYTAEERYAGKFYVSGVEVALRYVNFPGGPGFNKGIFNFRVHASNFEDNVQYQMETKDTIHGAYSSGNDLSDLNLMGNNVFDYDETEKRIQISLPGCGVDMFFRPADFARHLDQKARPGLVIGVNENDQDVVYTNVEESFCLSPNTDDGSVANVVEALKLDADQAFTYRAFEKRMTQDFPGTAAVECRAVSKMAREQCTDPDKTATAMQNCFFILGKPTFVSCYSKEEKRDSAGLLSLFRDCLNTYCKENKIACKGTQEAIAGQECSHLANAQLVGYDCEFRPQPGEVDGTVIP